MLALDFSKRSSSTELMDTEPASYEEFRACLVDLARVNALTRAHRPTVAFLERVVQSGLPRGRPLEIVDAGSGYGDLLREVSRWARARGVRVSLVGVDLNPWAARAATEATGVAEPIAWITGDALEYASHAPVDVIVSSLFTHHLPDPVVARFLSTMQRSARRGWFVNDLRRHPLPYHCFRHWSRWAGWHRFVQHDGPLSIARAFDRADWRRLLGDAGIDPAAVRIRSSFPFRLTVERIAVAP